MVEAGSMTVEDVLHDLIEVSSMDQEGLIQETGWRALSKDRSREAGRNEGKHPRRPKMSPFLSLILAEIN